MTTPTTPRRQLDRRAQVVPSPGRAPGVGAALALGLVGLVVVLACLDGIGVLGATGWGVGAACATVLALLVPRALGRVGRDTLLPADLVTLTRSLLACAAAALTAQALPGPPSPGPLLLLALPALALDAVDGRVARRTGTVSSFGGRFDGEADAFLILVLALAAAPTVGWWVLALGLARYVFGAAGWALPWMRRQLPPRYWRKVVTGTVGVALTAVAADVLYSRLAVILAVVALLLITESFGRDVWWLWRSRPAADSARGPRGRLRVAAGGAVVCVGVALCWFALLAPTRPDRLSVGSFLRLPVEVVVLLGLALVLPLRLRRPGMALAGAGLATIALAKVLDLGMLEVRGRPFDVVNDVGNLGAGLSVVDDSFGAVAATAALLGAALLVVGAVIGIPWTLVRTARAAARHRRSAVLGLAALALAWTGATALDLRTAAGTRVAAADSLPYASGKVGAVRASLADRARFDAAIRADAFAAPGSADLSLLRGKDVLVVIVESYGRVAVDGPQAEPVRLLLDGQASRLAAAGYSSRSAYLTSPVSGSGSWLAHSTLQAGLRVGDQGRYDRLLPSGRTTLTSAFAGAGWRTVAVLPSTRGEWPEGKAFYRFDRIYSRSDLGYAGPSFGFSAMPDQFTLAALSRLELERSQRPPVMAEVDLTSSHWPWAPLPATVDPSTLGDGRVFVTIQADAESAAQLWSDRTQVPDAYRASIVYSLTSVFDFVLRSRDPDLVLLVLGDHQPSTVVTGPGASRDVPVTLIAHDPAITDRVASWGWQPGLTPGDESPTWPMEDLRDRFLATFSDPVAR